MAEKENGMDEEIVALKVIAFIMLLLVTALSLTIYCQLTEIKNDLHHIENDLQAIQEKQLSYNKEPTICNHTCYCEPCTCKSHIYEQHIVNVHHLEPYTYQPQIVKISSSEPNRILEEQIKTYYRHDDQSIEYVIKIMCDNIESEILVIYVPNNGISKRDYFIVPGTVIAWDNGQYKVLLIDKECKEQYNSQIKSAMKERFEYMNFVTFSWDATINYWN